MNTTTQQSQLVRGVMLLAVVLLIIACVPASIVLAVFFKASWLLFIGIGVGIALGSVARRLGS